MKHSKARARLLALRQELEARHQRIDKHIGHRDEPLPADSEERAGELSNRETMEQIDDGITAELRQIDLALERIDLGCYGRCESCEQTIPPERIELIPFATRCVTCAGTAR